MRSVLWIAVVSVAAAVLAGFFSGAAMTLPARSERPVTVPDLAFPRGLTPLNDGGLLIAETGGGRVLRMSERGETSEVASGLPVTHTAGYGGNTATGVSAAVRVGDAYYYVVGEFRSDRFQRLYRMAPGSEPEPVTPPSGLDQGGKERFANPYDLLPASNGDFLVTDSGVNTVLRVTRSGEISLYADFPDQETPRSHPRYDTFPEIDVVPTGIARGPDGAVYVASLTGFPYPEGAANVYRLEDSNGDGDALDDGETTVFATGFTAATDLAFQDDGALLVTEFSEDMWRLARDLGLENAAQAPGRLTRWLDGEISPVAAGLVSPTSVATFDGRTFVSEEMAGRVRAVDATASGAVKEIGAAVVLIASLAGIAAGAVTFGAGLYWRATIMRRGEDQVE